MLSDFIQAAKLARSAGLISAADTSVIFYDLQRLDEVLEKLETAFGNTRQSVAIKTCPIPAVLQHIAQRGFALEAASIEEVRLAKSLKVGAKHIVFDSPVKTRQEISEAATDPNILLNCNSFEEVERIPTDARCQVGLRVNPLAKLQNQTQFNVSTPQSKFGVPISSRNQIIDAFARHKFLTALHMHIGSGIGVVDDHLAAVSQLLALANSINQKRKALGWPPVSTLDIGGGFKSYATTQENINLINTYAAGLKKLEGLFSNYKVCTEFGQLVHGPNGFVFTNIEYVRQADQLQQAFLHVGADLFMRNAYSNLGNALQFALVDEDLNTVSGPTQNTQLVGPLCFAGDELDKDILLPKIESGHNLIISNGVANTYGLWSRHCSRDMPKVLLYNLELGQINVAEERKQVW